MDFTNGKEPFVIHECSCGGMPIIDYDKNIITCEYCGAECRAIELTEVVVNWNRMNISETEMLEESLRITEKYCPSKTDPTAMGSSRKWPDRNKQERANGFVYIAHTTNTNNYKIGITKDITKRYKSFKTGNPNIYIIATKKSYDPRAEERMLHKIFCSTRINGEWFALTKEQISAAIIQYGFNYCLAAWKAE
jgi:hypothetical protein